nr:MAG TPA: hypothetical protein [Caudoviricetes sp.]
MSQKLGKVVLEIRRREANAWRVDLVTPGGRIPWRVEDVKKLDGMILTSRSLRYRGDQMARDFLDMFDGEFRKLGEKYDVLLHRVTGAATYVVVLTPVAGEQ